MCMTKQEYLQLKRYVKSVCTDTIDELSCQSGLTEYEHSLLLYLNKDTSRIKTCIDLGISEWKYTKDLQRALMKLGDYIKRTNQN